MKISFYQQTAIETEKQQTENRAVRKKKTSETQGVQGDSFFAVGQSLGNLSGQSVEKGKSFIELQQDAAGIDVGVSQDYMTLMSHTLSEEDYAKAQEEGFDFGSMNPEEAVTIVDKIKAELVRSGKEIVGYTDDLDTATLAAALGSQVLAENVAQSFAQADIPLTEENIELVAQAWNMAEQLEAPDEGSIRYLIDNGLSSEIWNLYLAENSGATKTVESSNILYRGDKVIENSVLGNVFPLADEKLSAQIESIIQQAGYNVNEESRRDAAWLLDNQLPLTDESLKQLQELKTLELPVAPEQFAEAVADVMAEGMPPVHALLSGRRETVYEKAVRLEQYYQGVEPEEKIGIENLTARRQLEEIRLRMTAEVNVKLLKSGFSIDTAPMEKLVDALKQAEEELVEQYFPQDTLAVEKYRSWQKTERVIADLPTLPADLLGSFVKEPIEWNVQPLEEFHREGKVLRDTYVKAEESYEALMTAPRRDLGDSIRKAFGNVDEILGELGLESTEENRRATRILGYNHMEINVENLDKIKDADSQVQTVIKKLTPAAVLKMIRDGINPLEKSFAELEQYFDNLPEDYKTESENYSRFLHGLERNQEITPEEREGYIGIYRLVRQIERADGAVVGALVNAQAELHFSNLLSAVRSGKFKSLDAKVGDNMGIVEELVRKGESISEQIGKAFASGAEKIMTDVSYSEEAEQLYYNRQLEEYRGAVTAADRETIAMLQRGELPAGADNILAARALLSEAEKLFGRRRTEKRETELWERLDNPEEFGQEYEEALVQAKADVENETFEETDNSLDVRRMQLTHKQLTVAAALAKKQEFFLPVYIGNRMTGVHLTLEQDDEGIAQVEIRVKSGEESGLQGVFRFEEGILKGFLKAENRNEVMKTERIADIFKKEAGENWKVGDISVVTGDVRLTATGRGTDAETENAELYRVAKSFLHAVQQGEMTDEN